MKQGWVEASIALAEHRRVVDFAVTSIIVEKICFGNADWRWRQLPAAASPGRGKLSGGSSGILESPMMMRSRVSDSNNRPGAAGRRPGRS
eukprot:8754845-Pyramimonas_sp.AAC.1